MRMSKTHKIAVTTVVTTIAAATVLTFTRPDTAVADRIASLPKSSSDSPVVASRTPGATTEPSPSEKPPEPEPTKAPKPTAKPVAKPPKATTKPAPTTHPAPSPTPTPQKNLIEILLGQ